MKKAGVTSTPEKLDAVIARVIAELRKKRAGAAPGRQTLSLNFPGST